MCPSLSDVFRDGQNTQASPVKDKSRVPGGTVRKKVHFFCFSARVAKSVGCKS